MAEETHIQTTGPNGERLSFQVGTKSIAVYVRDLLPVLLLIAIIVLGYLRYVAVDKHLERLALGQDALGQRILEGLHQQNGLLAQQTAEMKRLFAVVEYNRDKDPGDRLPLELQPPAPPPH